MGPLVTTEWLAGARGVRIVDASWFLPEHGRDAAAEYRSRHIPGAEFLDLPSARPGGIDLADPSARIVVYDDSPLRTAARGWWLLRSSGAEHIAILDGGLAKWRAEGRPLEAGEGRHLTSSPNAVPPPDLRDLASMRATTDQVVDARSPARFAGEEPEPRPGVVPGHIPGAKNLHYAKLFHADGMWKSPAEIDAAFADAGIDLTRPITATCGSGVTACTLIFGLELLARDAHLYGGSWAEWGSDRSTPKATGVADEHDDTKPETKVVRAGRRAEWTQGIVNPPVWRASTILYDSVADLRDGAKGDTHHRLFYGRRGTPTQWSLADALTELEPGAKATFLYPSGVAAMAAALLSVLSAGDEVLIPDSAYDPTRGQANGLLGRMGIAARFYDPCIGAGIADLIGPTTRAILMESPGSLTFEVQDIPAIVGVAKAHGIATLLDNTWATPLRLPAMALGIDLSVLACTKYVSGHSDVMIGSVTATAAYYARLRDTTYQLGQTVGPDDAYLAARGLRTMAVRLDRHEASALTIAKWLKGRPEIAAVLHPALPDCPGSEVFHRDFRGGTGLFAFELAGGGEAARAALIDALDLFGIGYSWGGYESLALPVDPARHRTVTEWTRGPLVRLSIGLEHPDDLIADLERGLSAWARA